MQENVEGGERERESEVRGKDNKRKLQCDKQKDREIVRIIYVMKKEVERQK